MSEIIRIPQPLSMLLLFLIVLLSDGIWQHASSGITTTSAFGLLASFPGNNRPAVTRITAAFPSTQSNLLVLRVGPENGSEASLGSAVDMGSVPSFIQSPVLKELYPDLLRWKETYGHPNIPLKNPGGKLCLTVRRMHIQSKLQPAEIQWLSDIGFIFHSLEEVYKFADFDDMLARLMQYERTHPESNFQVPKKCPEDPELGAWVTGLRRLGQDGVNPEHERRLNEVGFKWISSRQCGSKFMLKYRDLVEQVELRGLDEVLSDPETVPWIKAQQEALKRGGLSQTRVHYMGQLFGDMWTTIGKALP
jgi:hypothetical protein